jgi:hypothetical protein
MARQLQKIAMCSAYIQKTHSNIKYCQVFQNLSAVDPIARLGHAFPIDGLGSSEEIPLIFNR